MIIDNIEVELSKVKKAFVSDYTVYNNKIWRVVGYNGPANGNTFILERMNTQERISISNKEKLYAIIKPTGYIDI